MFSDVGRRRSVKRETCGKYANSHIHTQERDDRTKIYESFLIKQWCGYCVCHCFNVVRKIRFKYRLTSSLSFCSTCCASRKRSWERMARWRWWKQDFSSSQRRKQHTRRRQRTRVRKSRVNGFPLFAFYVLFTYDESQILSARAKWFIAVDFIVVGENSLWWWIYGILHRNVLAHSRVVGRDVCVGAMGGRWLAYERWKAFQST